MSDKVMQNFTEKIRALGYPRHISPEDFQSPNFPLVAEIIYWLAQLINPNLTLPKCIYSEQDRLNFIKSVIQFFVLNLFIKINPVKLYNADRHAIKEISKVINLFYSKYQLNEETLKVFESSELFRPEELEQLQNTRSLANELIAMNEELKPLISQDTESRRLLRDAADQYPDIENIKICLKQATDLNLEEINKLEKEISVSKLDEGILDEKIEKRRVELERNRKRLSTLQSVRPAYVAEYEELEEELKFNYQTYVSLLRNLNFLEGLHGEKSISLDTGDVEMNGFSDDLIAKEIIPGCTNVENIFPKHNPLSTFDPGAPEEPSPDSLGLNEPIKVDSESICDRERSSEDDFGFINALSVVGHRYKMVHDWTPCLSKKEDHPEETEIEEV